MIRAGNVSSQTRKQRYPHANSSPPTAGLSLIADDSDEDETSTQLDAGPNQPPNIAEWRSNLIALSQVENLYYVAFQESIHVTAPRGLKQNIPGKPDLIIDLPRTRDGIRVGGYLDRSYGHCPNYIKVGNLGNLEILLVACDDGDIIAYYTHVIQSVIKTQESQSIVRPFFHENVGISAWGLAIHSKSRMIAVSSNHREVVVFHLGLRNSRTTDSPSFYESSGDDSSDDSSVQCKIHECDHSYSALFPLVGGMPSTMLGHNFRMVIKLGPEGHNIPSIDFSSNEHGFAHSILAADINGNLWILDLWRKRGGSSDLVKRIPSLYRHPTRGQGMMGWGVLPIPLHAFKQITADPDEALAALPCRLSTICVPLKGKFLDRHLNFDITSTLAKVDVGNISSFHPQFGYGINGPGSTPSLPILNTDGLGMLTSYLPDGSLDPFSKTVEENDNVFTCSARAFSENTRRYFEALVNMRSLPGYASTDKYASLSPWAGVVVKEEEQKVQELVESERRFRSGEPGKGPTYHLRDKCAILRTFQDHIELLPPCENMLPTLCRKILRQDLPGSIRHHMNFERLNLNVLIPELSLVIVGSQVGRVALVRLTRPEDSFSEHGPATFFRVEHILPTYTHEIQGFRPAVPLLGITASPLQGQARERRIWRLMMQYYDHSILSYELREEGQGILVV